MLKPFLFNGSIDKKLFSTPHEDRDIPCCKTLKEMALLLDYINLYALILLCVFCCLCEITYDVHVINELIG